MNELKKGFRAVFYSGDKKVSVFSIRDTYKEAEKDIEKENALYSMFKYTPWTHTKVEEVNL